MSSGRTAVVSQICPACGADLSDEKIIVMIADMHWGRGSRQWNAGDKESTVRFSSTKNSRSAYCSLDCLKKDLDENFDRAKKISDRRGATLQ